MSQKTSEFKVNLLRKSDNQIVSKPNLRLRYSSTYFKKVPQGLFNSLSILEQKKILESFKLSYALILFDYFSLRNQINDRVDCFAKEAFRINLPMSKVVEIHADLIDNLERQLMFEGLRSETLSDFRATLIDVIAHLGKIYGGVI